MTDKEWKTKLQIIVAKMAMGVKITVSEKKFLLRHKAHEVVNRDRLRRAA